MINRNRNSAVAKAQADMKCAVNSSSRQLNCVRDSQDTFASTTEFLNAIDTAINSNPRMGINRKCGEINQLISIATDSEGCDQSVVKKVDRLFDNFMNTTANNTSAKSMAENFKKLNDKIQALNSNCNSSRRSANRLNSSRYTKDKMIKAMEAAGYYYDDIDSNDANYVVFESDYGPLRFDNMNDVADWLDGVVFDDPEVADKVDAILNSNRRGNSSRRRSLKTRKAVEYSINCARRRARFGR
jgi:hypothetical protein